MKKAEMIEIKNSRKNLIGFLHLSDLLIIRDLIENNSKVAFDTNYKSFYDLCDLILSLLERKEINNKTASKIFEILAAENTRFRTESHRFQNNSIYEYNEEKQSYIFAGACSRKEFNKIVHYID